MAIAIIPLIKVGKPSDYRVSSRGAYLPARGASEMGLPIRMGLTFRLPLLGQYLNRLVFIFAEKVVDNKLGRCVAVVVKARNPDVSRLVEGVTCFQMLDRLSFNLESNGAFSDNSHGRTGVKVKWCLLFRPHRHFLNLDG